MKSIFLRIFTTPASCTIRYKLPLITLLIMFLAACGGKKPLKPLDEFSSKSHAHKENIDVYVSPFNEFECAELFPGHQPLLQKPAIRPIHITIDNNRNDSVVFALNKTNLATIPAEELYEILKSSPLAHAALGMIINSISMSLAFKSAQMIAVALNPLYWLQLLGYAMFSSGPLRAPAGIVGLCAALPPLVYFALAKHSNTKLHDMLNENSLKNWQLIDAHGSVNGLVYIYTNHMPDILELSLHELGKETESINFTLPLTYQGLKQQSSKA